MKFEFKRRFKGWFVWIAKLFFISFIQTIIFFLILFVIERTGIFMLEVFRNNEILLEGEVGAFFFGLILTQVRIGVLAANGANKVNYIRGYGWSDHDTRVTVLDDLTDRTAPGTYTYNIADVQIGGVYSRFIFHIAGTNATASLLGISFAEAEYYYG